MDQKQNGKRAVIVVLVILLAYAVVLFDQRSVGKATFQSADAAAEFTKTIEDQGGQIVPFPVSEGDARVQEFTPEEQKFLEQQSREFREQPSSSIDSIFEQTTTTLSASEAGGFMAAIRGLNADTNSQNKATSAAKTTDIANLFKQRIRGSGITLAGNANSLMQKIKSGGR